MLKQRLLTALVLVPLVVWSVLMLPSKAIMIGFALVVLLGTKEWATLIQIPYGFFHSFYVMASFVVMTLVLWLSSVVNSALTLLIVALLWWCCSLIWLVRFARQMHAEERDPIVNYSRAAQLKLAGVGWLVLVPAWMSAVWIHQLPEVGGQLLLYVLVLVWSADSGAYFFGRRWGRRKLAPHISPGKSWEGVMGAVLFSVVVGVIAIFLFGMGGQTALLFIMLSVVVSLFSIVGDLFESMMKRRAGLKDSGMLLPGHGGVLDRIDSLTVALPVFLLGLFVFGII